MSDIAGKVGFGVNVAVGAAEMATWSPARIAAFFAGLAQAQAALGPRDLHEAIPRPHSAAEVNELERHLLALETRVAEQGELLDRIAEEVAGLHGLVTEHLERIVEKVAFVHDLASALEKAPERPVVAAGDPEPALAEMRARVAADAARPPVPAAEVFAGVAVTVTDDPEAGIASPVADGLRAHAEAVEAVATALEKPGAADTLVERTESTDLVGPESAAPKKRSTSEGKRQKRLALARALASGPARMADLCKAIGMADSTASNLLAHEWFAKLNGKFSPYALTDAGRAALAADGYVLVPGETKPIPEEPKAPEPETKPAEVEIPVPEAPTPTAMDALLAPKQSLDNQERRKAQVLLIAQAIAGSERPLGTDEIAKEAGLPYENVAKLLNRYGPSAMGLRYFFKSEKHPGCWRLSNSGTELLAKEGAQQQ